MLQELLVSDAVVGAFAVLEELAYSGFALVEGALRVVHYNKK